MKIIFVFLLSLPLCSFASIEVAFIEIRNDKNEIIQLEPGGQYAHLAISYRGNWLHSYPPNGVEVISQQDLEKIGTIKTIVTVSAIESVNEEVVRYYLGRP